MGEHWKSARVPTLLALALVVGGCGSDSGATADRTTSQHLYPEVKGPSREFLVPGGDNIVQTFGHEASARERRRASRVIHASMKARLEKNWAADCETFAREYVEILVKEASQASAGRASNCPQALSFIEAEESEEVVNTLTGPVDSLRVRKSGVQPGRSKTEMEAYTQYHGRHGIDWIVPMRRERGAWKVMNRYPLERRK